MEDNNNRFNQQDQDDNDIGNDTQKTNDESSGSGSYDSRNGEQDRSANQNGYGYGGYFNGIPGGQQNNGQHYSPRPSSNGYYYPGGGNNTPQPQKSNSGKILAIIAVVLVLSLSVGYAFNLAFGYLKDLSDDNGQTPEQSQNPNQNEGNNTSPDNSGLLDDDFVLEQVPASEHYKLSSVYQATKNTVVEITTETVTTGSFMQQYVTTGAGSGVIISADGYIVTNHHVIDGASKVMVKLSDGTQYEAVLVGSDEKSDIAVIKIEPVGELSVATIGVSEDLMECEEILIIGNPLGSLGGSATNGIISAKAREISIGGNMMTLIQTNAAVNPGNSGGAMFNLAGQLVGIVNAKYTDEAVEGIGFAIPIDVAKPIIEDLIKVGYVTGRNNIGIKIEYGTYIQSVGKSNWITQIATGSDAEKAGLMKYDEIVSINGISFTSAELVNAYLDSLAVGQDVKIVIRRYTKISSSFWGTEYKAEEMTFNFKTTEYVKTK